MTSTDIPMTSPSPSSEVDYSDLCGLAVKLNLALLDADVLKLASEYLMSTLPSITFTRFVHSINNFTQTVIIRPGGAVERWKSARATPAKGPVGEYPTVCGEHTAREGGSAGTSFSADEPEAASVHVAPMHSKGKALGTLTVGSSSPDAFAGRRAEAVDIIAAMVAPYMHIHDLRQHLEVKQTCLVDCLPAKVASHMLEKRSLGMTPVMHSAEYDTDASSSDGHDHGDGT